jgi:acyl carrier protein
VQPRNSLEQQIAQIWKDTLKIPAVGVNDNFFDLGGHSLLLMQLHSRLVDALGRTFPMLDLLSHPTVAALAAHLGRKDGEDQSLLAGQSRAGARKQSATARTRAALRQGVGDKA